jgi:4,5-dihydroxyphthalate decarboxylase
MKKADMRQNRIQLTFAMTSYDHTHAITAGEVEIAGVDPIFIDLPIPESFRRFINTQDWDVAEMSSAQYVTRRLGGDDRIVALPIFTSRMFRHSCVYVRKDRIAKPEDLRGARVGTTEWILTACVYARGLLSDMYGITPADMSWVQAGMDRPGRAQAVLPPAFPDGVELVSEPERTLQDMLWAGEIDAVMAPQYPLGFRTAAASSDLVGRLFEQPAGAEREYFAKTGVFPIMHMVGIRREVLEQHRWVASNIYRAFEVARRRYFARLEDIAASRVPIPWIGDHLDRLCGIFGQDIWPYGIEPNRTTIETFLRYAAEQGLISDPDVDVADLFAPIEPFVDGM